MNRSCISFISILCSLSLLYSNCVYAFPQNNTLSSTSAFTSPEFRGEISNLADSLSTDRLAPERVIEIARGHLARLLPHRHENPVIGGYVEELQRIAADAKKKLKSTRNNPLNALSDNVVRDLIYDVILYYFQMRGISRTLLDNIIRGLEDNIGNPELALINIYSRLGPPQDSEISRAYSGSYRAIDKHRNVIALIGKYIAGGVVADVGCGDNILSIHLLNSNPAITKVIGVDISDRAKKIDNPKIEFRKMDKTDRIPIEDGAVDIVLLRYVLHHIYAENREEFLSEIYRILKPGGRVIIIEETSSDNMPPVYGSSLINRFTSLTNEQRYAFLRFIDWFDAFIVYRISDMPLPSTFHSMEEWKNILENKGFNVKEMKFYGFPPEPFTPKSPMGLIIIEKPDNTESPKAVIESIRQFFGKEYQEGGKKAKIYENIIAPVVEEYGLWLGVKKVMGFRTIPVIAGIVFILWGVMPFFTAGVLAILVAQNAGPFINSHKYIGGKIGALAVTAMIGPVFIITPLFLAWYYAIPIIIFSPFIVHSLWNTFAPLKYKAICDLMYSERRMRERIQEEWRRQNREPSKKEIDDAVENIEKSTEELKETFADVEEAILDEIKEEGGFSTELDDEAQHELRRLIIESAGEYAEKGGKDFDEWLSKLPEKLQKVFLEDSPEKIQRLLASERIKASLRKAFDFSQKNFPDHPPAPGGPGKLAGVFHDLDHLLHDSMHRRGMEHDHSHPHGAGHHHHPHDHGHSPKLKSIIWFIFLTGASILHYLLTGDQDAGFIFAMALPLIPGGGDSQLPPKPEIIDTKTIDLARYVQDKKVKDYYFSSSVAEQLDSVVGRSKREKPTGPIKNNALLVGTNSDLLESVMESTVSRMTSERNGKYPNLARPDYLIFNPAYLVDNLASSGTIDELISKLTTSLEEYYSERGVILFINFQDLYDLGQLERGRTDADSVAGIYMRLAPLLESKKITLVGLATKALAGRLSTENRLTQNLDIIPLEETRDYRIVEIIRDELNWLNEYYKGKLGTVKIRMKPAERTQLADRLAKLRLTQEPPQILRDKLEDWFRRKFLRKEELLWEQNYHTEQIEKLILQYKNSPTRSELLDQYMHKWLEYHLNELSRIKTGLEGTNVERDTYWLTADELIPREMEWEEKVPGLAAALKEEVIDQNPAIEAIQRAFERAQVIHDKDHPICNFIFIGPTGVGKTEVARALNRYFGWPVVRIDGSEHGEAADMYKLIGPPPAIIGHEQGGTLTNEVARYGFCFVLFDELEKAHATIQDLFLQVIDGARLTDGKGRTVSFQNAGLLMTSNLGYRAVADEPQEIKTIKGYIKDEIMKMTDDDVAKVLQRLLEDYRRLNEKVSVFEKEIADIQKLLEGGVVADGKVVSLAEWKTRREGKDEKKKSCREYLKEYIENMFPGECICNPGILNNLFSRLNYYEDSEALTGEDENNLSALLAEITRRYENHYKNIILRYILHGEAVPEELVSELREIQETREDQRDFYLKKMRTELETGLRQVIRNSFKQEFLNKLGENNIIIFSPLTKKALRKILSLKIKEVNTALEKNGYGKLSLEGELIELILKEGFRPDMGARPLIRALKKIVLEPLSEAILKKELPYGRDITASMAEAGPCTFEVKGPASAITENGTQITNLLQQLKERPDITIEEALGILTLSPSTGVGHEGPASDIDFTIKLPPEEGEEDTDLLKVDTNRLDELERALTAQLEELKGNIQQLETQFRATTENSQRQLLQFQIYALRQNLEIGEGKIEIIRLRKQQKNDDARALQERIRQKRQGARERMEKEINDIFENLTILARENKLEEQPTDPSVIYRIMDILKSSHRNDPFLIDPSFIVQHSVVEEIVRRDDPELKRTRFLRLKLTKLTSYLSLVGYFEARMRDILGAIHQDNLNKNIRTVIVMDLAEVQKEIVRMRYNPFLLSFFLRLFHKDPDISFLMTTSDSSSASEDAFNRYFREVQVPTSEPDKLLESTMLCSEAWMRDTRDAETSLKGLIPFEIKQRSLRIWRQFYSGEPALDTIKGWFKGIMDTRRRSKREIGSKRDELIRDILGRINSIWQDMQENEETGWTIERLVGDRDLIELLEALNKIDATPSLRAVGEAISKEELDVEITRQERARIALKQGEEIDIESIDINPEQRALGLEEALNKKIYGQRESIKKVASSVKINTAGLKLRNQPVGSFLFGGPTGVGKTETAKQTAKSMGMRFLRIDMSEFKTKEDVWKLIGAPRGYIGWESGEGSFIEWMRKYPRTVILFDEVEKGHPDVLNILLQILEDGILTSNRGNKVDFSESIIFITSNLGVKEEVIMPDGSRQTVFDMYPEMEEIYRSGDAGKIEEFNNRMVTRVNKRISEFFRPELLNRLDAVEVFLPFKKEDTLPIAVKLLEERIANLEIDHGIKVEAAPDDLETIAKALVEAGFSPKSGARDMERLSKEWVTQGFRPILKEVRKLPKDTRIMVKRPGLAEAGHPRGAWVGEGPASNIAFEILGKEELTQLPEQVAERVQLLFTTLQQIKGEPLSEKDIYELFYPMEVKGKLTGKKAPFAEKATVREIQNASPTKADDTPTVIASDLTSLRAEGEAISLIEPWLRETISLAKRLNLWRHIWEKDKRFTKDFWGLDRAGIKALYDEYQQDDKLGDKTIEILYEERPGLAGVGREGRASHIVLGIKLNSHLGRDLERILVETQYESEDHIRQLLHNRKSLQGFLIALLKLKQAGINIEFELNPGSTVFWVQIPIKKLSVEDLTLAEVVDISKRMTDLLDYILGKKLNAGQILTFIRSQELKGYCVENNIPYDIAAGFLENQVIVEKTPEPGIIIDHQERYTRLKQFFKTAAGINNLSELPQPEEALQDIKAELYRLFTLDSDGTPMVRRRITANVDEIFSKVSKEKLSFASALRKNTFTDIKQKNGEVSVSMSNNTLRLDTTFYFFYDKKNNQFSIGKSVAGTKHPFSDLGQYNVDPEKEGNPLINIGISYISKRYVFVINDKLYDIIKTDPDFLKFCRAESPELSWEVISESECNWRLTIDPEFRKLFNWSEKNVVTAPAEGRTEDKERIRADALLLGAIVLAVRRGRMPPQPATAPEPGPVFSPAPPESWKTGEATEEILKEVKDIARRWAGVFQRIGKAVEAFGDGAKRICIEEKIPYEEIKRILDTLSGEGLTGAMAQANWDCIKQFFADASNIDSLEKIQNIQLALGMTISRETLYRLLTLNPDATPMERRRINANINELFNQVAPETLNKGPTAGISVKIEKETAGKIRIHLRNDNLSFYPQCSFSYVSEVLRMELPPREPGQRMKFYRLIEGSNLIINIGISTDSKRYVIVLKDTVYDIIKNNSNFLQHLRAEGPDLSYEIISESECNWRLTTDPEFRKLFNWSDKNVTTGPAPSEPWQKIAEDGDKLGNDIGDIAVDPETGIIYAATGIKKNIARIYPDGRIDTTSVPYNTDSCYVTKKHIFVATAFVSTAKGVWVYSKDTMRIDTSIGSNGVIARETNCRGVAVIEDGDGYKIFISTIEEILVFDKSNYTNPINTLDISLPRGMYINKNGELFATYESGVCIINTETMEIEYDSGNIPPSMVTPYLVIEDENGYIYVRGSASNEIIIFSRSDEEWDNKVKKLIQVGKIINPYTERPRGIGIRNGKLIIAFAGNLAMGQSSSIWETSLYQPALTPAPPTTEELRRNSIEIDEIIKLPPELIKALLILLNLLEGNTQDALGTLEKLDLSEFLAKGWFVELLDSITNPDVRQGIQAIIDKKRTTGPTETQPKGPLYITDDGTWLRMQKIIEADERLGIDLRWIAVDKKTGYMYVATGLENTVVIINNKGEIIDTIHVGVYTNACYVTDRHIFIATRNGIYVCGKETRELDTRFGEEGIIGKGRHFIGIAVRERDDNYEVFASNFAEQKVCKYTASNNYARPSKTIRINNPQNMYSTSDGKIALAHGDRVAIINPDSMKVEYYSEGIIPAGTYSVAEDSNGYIYVSSPESDKTVILKRSDDTWPDGKKKLIIERVIENPEGVKNPMCMTIKNENLVIGNPGIQGPIILEIQPKRTQEQKEQKVIPEEVKDIARRLANVFGLTIPKKSRSFIPNLKSLCITNNIPCSPIGELFDQLDQETVSNLKKFFQGISSIENLEELPELPTGLAQIKGEIFRLLTLNPDGKPMPRRRIVPNIDEIFSEQHEDKRKAGEWLEITKEKDGTVKLVILNPTNIDYGYSFTFKNREFSIWPIDKVADKREYTREFFTPIPVADRVNPILNIGLSDDKKRCVIVIRDGFTPFRDTPHFWNHGIVESPDFSYEIITESECNYRLTIDPEFRRLFNWSNKNIRQPTAKPAVSKGSISEFLSDIKDKKLPRADIIIEEEENSARIAVSPDGRYIATDSVTDILRLYDTTTGKLVAERIIGANGIESLAFSNDGRFLAIGCVSSQLVLIDLKDKEDIQDAFNNEFIRAYGFSGRVISMAFTPDDRFLAVGTNGRENRFIELKEEGKTEYKDKKEMEKAFEKSNTYAVKNLGESGGLPISLSCSPDGRFLAVGTDSKGRLLLIELKEKGEDKYKDKRSIQEAFENPHITAQIVVQGKSITAPVNTTSFSPEGRFLAVGTSTATEDGDVDDYTLQLIELKEEGTDEYKDKKEMQEAFKYPYAISTAGSVPSLIFSSDGRFLVYRGGIIELKEKDSSNYKDRRAMQEAFNNLFARIDAEISVTDIHSSKDGSVLCLAKESKLHIYKPQGKTPDTTDEVLKEIKDIARRLENVFKEINTEWLIGAGYTFQEVVADTIRGICISQKLPLDLLTKICADILAIELTKTRFELIQRFFREVASIDSLDKLPILPVNLITLKERLFRLLTLNPDRTPMERQRITANVDEIFNKVSGDKLEIGDRLKIQPGTMRIKVGDAFTGFILSGRDGPVINIGISTEGPRRYVFVFKDSYYDEEKGTPAFISYRQLETTELSWEFISESECNYRLTVDPEFRKFFNWSANNIITGPKKETDAYFGGMTDSEIDPQIKRILGDPDAKDFYFVRGRSTEERIGKLKIPSDWRNAILGAYSKLRTEYSDLGYYGIPVLKGVNFSGHNSVRRHGRIYISYEILEIFFNGIASPSARNDFLTDYVEHEFLHSIGWSEEEILENSNRKRPGVYEEARRLYRIYIAKKLVDAVSGTPLLRAKLERLLRRVQENKRIELTETELHRLLWLIDRSKEINIVPEICELINLILEPDYTGNPAHVVMAIEKEMLEWLNKKPPVPGLQSQVVQERQKLLVVHRTVQGDIRFEGPDVPKNVRDTVNYVYRTQAPEPARKEKTRYILIDEFRAEKCEGIIKKISEAWNVEFVTEIPEGVNVTALVDPEDADESQWKDNRIKYHLPLIYMETSLILAAELATTDSELKDTQAFRFVKGFYETLLGETIPDTEVISWFLSPWLLRDKLKSLTEEIRFLRIATSQLDSSA